VPFLRVIRDKRGYETTFLMDWHREGERQRSHILYVFRTPGGTRVGREALDAHRRQEIEARYPHIDFDWGVVLKTQQVVEAASEPRRPRRRRSEEPGTGAEGRAAPRPQPAASPLATPVPAVIEGSTPDERMAFLGTWYPRVRERVLQRHSDPARREALLALTERLTPTGWTDADRITTGLETAAEALERLAHVLGKRRRRPRRSRAERALGAVAMPSPDDAATPEADAVPPDADAPKPHNDE
jgi:hypothetical protein